MSAPPPGSHIILYDGLCVLCNRFTRYVLGRDRNEKYRFASLQSRFARTALARYRREPFDQDTVYLVVRHSTDQERLLFKARAVLFVLGDLGGVWRAATVLRILPAPLLDLGYDLLARIRYRVFGKLESCPLPGKEHRDRFIEV